MPSAARTISMAKTSVAEDDDRAREKREARMKEKVMRGRWGHAAVAKEKVGQGQHVVAAAAAQQVRPGRGGGVSKC